MLASTDVTRSPRRRRSFVIGSLLVIGTSIATVSTVGVSNAGTAASCTGEAAVAADGTPMTCTFDDEFSAATGDATALDTTKWQPQLTATSGFVTGTPSATACYVDSPNNISVGSGYLALTARREAEPFVCHGSPGDVSTTYTAGQVTSAANFSQTYGRFEVRAKLPSVTVAGLQETLWLWPEDPTHYGPSWPDSGEIDFSEFYSSLPNTDVPFIHYFVDPGANPASHAVDNDGRRASAHHRRLTAKHKRNRHHHRSLLPSPTAPVTPPLPTPMSDVNTTTATCPINYGSFNTYVASWTPGSIQIEVNGTTCLVDNYQALGLPRPAPFDQPFVLMLTQALGMGDNAFDPATTPLPATTLVDYVRVWQ